MEARHEMTGDTQSSMKKVEGASELKTTLTQLQSSLLNFRYLYRGVMLVDGRYIGIVDTLKLISSNSFVAAAPRKKKQLQETVK